MDLNLSAAMEAKPETTSKRQAVGSTPHELQKYLETTMKATCSLKFAERIFRAVCTDTFVLDPTDRFIKESKEVTVAYNKRAKEMSAEARRRSLGEPHAHVFNCWVKIALEWHKEKGNTQEVARLTKFTEIMGKAGSEQALLKLAQQVRYAFVTVPRGGNNRKSRLEANVRETIVEIDPEAIPDDENLGLKILPCPCYAAWLSIRMALEAKGAEHKQGMPPAGDLERRVQNAINEMSGEPARYRLDE